MCGNFIKLDRKITKWEWWSDINTFRVFIYMLISAYWKDGNYKGILIPRGSFPSSISDLAKETNLTENEIRTALKHLKSTGEITSKSTNRFTVFTVNNYNLYQSINEQEHEQNTNKSQAINKPLTSTILKEYKNIKNNNICAPESHDTADDDLELEKNFDIIYAIYPKKKGKTVAFSNYKQWVGKGKDVGGKKYRLTNRQIYLAVKNYIRQQEEAGQDDLTYWKNFDTLMGRQLLDYIVEEEE